MADGILDHRNHAYIANVRAVIQVVRLQALDILTCLVDSFLEDLCVFVVPPCVRRLVVADSDTINELIGRMNKETQTINTVAAVLVRVGVAVTSCCIQQVACYLYSALFVNPYVRSIYIGNMLGRVVEVTRIDIQT